MSKRIKTNQQFPEFGFSTKYLDGLHFDHVTHAMIDVTSRRLHNVNPVNKDFFTR